MLEIRAVIPATSHDALPIAISAFLDLSVKSGANHKLTSLAKNVILVFTSMVVSLGSVEIGLRWFDYDPLQSMRDGREAILRISGIPGLEYELTPLAEGRAWGADVKVSSQGLRDREFPVERNHRFRIVVLGDSITFGNFLSVEDTYPKKLEDLLNADDKDAYEVLNFGVGGYDLHNYLALLKGRVVQYAPDLVVIGLCVNDIGVASPNRAYIEGLLPVGEGLDSRLWLFVRQSLARVMIANWQERLNADSQYRKVYEERIRSVDDDPFLVQAISDLSTVAKRHSLPLFLLLYASPSHVGTLGYNFGQFQSIAVVNSFKIVVIPIPVLTTDHENEWAIATRIIDHELRKYGIDKVDVAPEFWTTGLSTLRVNSADSVHPNSRGHQLIAAKLRDYILDQRVGSGSH